MVDANSAYTLADLETLKSLDEFNLLMIEQPFQEDDFIQHAKLQRLSQHLFVLMKVFIRTRCKTRL